MADHDTGHGRPVIVVYGRSWTRSCPVIIGHDRVSGRQRFVHLLPFMTAVMADHDRVHGRLWPIMAGSVVGQGRPWPVVTGHDRSWLRSWFVQLFVDHNRGHSRVYHRSRSVMTGHDRPCTRSFTRPRRTAMAV